jgi:hypothetical protein
VGDAAWLDSIICIQTSPYVWPCCAYVLHCREEFKRCGKQFPAPGVTSLDVCLLFPDGQHRRLCDAVQQYLHRPHYGAHGAMQDVLATMQLLQAMVSCHCRQE